PEIAQAFEQEYANGPRRYAPLKEAVSDAIVELTSAMRQRREVIAADREQVKRLMREGAEKARAIARATMKDVRRMTGLPKHND
ncbi:MAG: hypothetical protein ACUVR3_14045, partial [Candidatus Roseilinea sp.]